LTGIGVGLLAISRAHDRRPFELAGRLLGGDALKVS
jgi:hypothetical protein